jgi:hypothetical protein
LQDRRRFSFIEEALERRELRRTHGRKREEPACLENRDI